MLGRMNLMKKIEKEKKIAKEMYVLKQAYAYTIFLYSERTCQSELVGG